MSVAPQSKDGHGMRTHGLLVEPSVPRCHSADADRQCILPYGHQNDPRDTGCAMECLKNHCHGIRRNQANMPRSDSDGPYKDGLCHRPAGWGTQHVGIGVCKLHGGNAPNVIKAAQKVMLEQGAATYGLPSNISPIEALTEELHRTHGHVLDRLFHLQMLTPDEVLSGPGADLRRNYLEERKHLVEVAQVLTRGGAEQQIGRYIGMQADLLDRGIAWLMAALGRDDPRAQVLLDHLLESLHRGEVPAALPAGEVVDADVVPTEGVGDG